MSKSLEEQDGLSPQASSPGARRGLWRSLRRDVRAALEQDPAARSALEVVLAYPGFHARQFHRLAHRLYRWRLRLPARLVSHVGRGLTGIEIHPGAQIGEGLFID